MSNRRNKMFGVRESAQLSLEVLEDRIVLAQWLWVGDDHGDLWSVADNWAQIGAPDNRFVSGPPAAFDSVVFDPTRMAGGVAGSDIDSKHNITPALGFSVTDIVVSSSFTRKIELASGLAVHGIAQLNGGTIASDDGKDFQILTENGIPGVNSISNVTFAGAHLVVGSTQAVLRRQVETNIDGKITLKNESRIEVLSYQTTGSTVPYAGSQLAWIAGNISLGKGSRIIIREGAFFRILCDKKNLGEGPVVGDGKSRVIILGHMAKTSAGGTTTLDDVTFRITGGAAVLYLFSGVVAFTNSDINQEDGVTKLAGGSLTTDTNFVMDGGLLWGYGTITGVVQNNRGVVAPGSPHSTDPLIVSGYTQGAAGTLRIDFWGNGVGKIGVLKTTANLNLAGKLEVKKSSTEIPNASTRDIVFWEVLVGDFASAKMPTWSDGGFFYTWELFKNVPDKRFQLRRVMIPPGRARGMAWKDLNGDGLRGGEPALAELPVTLRDETGAVVATAVTTADGAYDFYPLGPGDFTITFDAPLEPGHFTLPNQGTDDAIDSDVNSAGSLAFTMATAGEFVADAGYFALIDTSLSLSASPTTSELGQAVTFTATVSPATYGGPAVGGEVAFYHGSTLLATVPVTLAAFAAQAEFTTSSLPLGNHSVSAVYAGDDHYLGSESGVVDVTVVQPSAGLSLWSSSPTSSAGQEVTFTALASGGGPVPTGTVTFSAGGVALATVPLSPNGMMASEAVFGTGSLAVGTHEITAVYNGDAIYSAGTTATLTQTVVLNSVYLYAWFPIAPQVGVASELAFVASGNGPTPTGSVSFLLNGVLIGSAALDGSGGGTFAWPPMSAGTHTITVVYGGDSVYEAAVCSFEIDL